jgi:hypothetical protein
VKVLEVLIHPLLNVTRFLQRLLPQWAPPRHQQHETPSSLPPAPLFLSIRAHRTFTMQPTLRRRRLGPSRCPHHRSSAPEPSLEVTNPPIPLISHLLHCCPRNRLPELMCAAVWLLRHRSRPLVPLHRCRAHGWVRYVTSSSLESFPSALDPRCGRALASGETSPWSQATPPRAGQKPSPSLPSDLSRPSEIWRPNFN